MGMKSDKKWKVVFSKKSLKQLRGLSPKITHVVYGLKKDIEDAGPVRGDWPNYSSLGKNRHHCHLKKAGKPTYVCVWEVIDKKIKIVEVSYVGTRENAPY